MQDLLDEMAFQIYLKMIEGDRPNYIQAKIERNLIHMAYERAHMFIKYSQEGAYENKRSVGSTE